MKKHEEAMDKALGHGDYAPAAVVSEEMQREIANSEAGPPGNGELAPFPPEFFRLVKGTQEIVRAKDKRRLFNLLQVQDDQLKEIVRKQHSREHPFTFLAVAWIAWPGTMVDDKTGEVIPVTRVAIQLEGGQTLGCASDGIAKSLFESEFILSPSPWSPPRRFELSVTPAKVGDLYKLRIPDDC